MNRDQVIQYLNKHYRQQASLADDVLFLKQYCLHYGNIEQSKNVDIFLLELLKHLHLFLYCLDYAINECEFELSVVKIIAKKDTYGMNVDRIITVY